MAHTRPFARPHALKVIATLCVLCALAFALGQETAAFHAAQMRAAVATAPTTHAAPLPTIPTAVAHGETHSAATASQSPPAQELAVSVSQPSSGHGHAHKHSKQKHGSEHDAAGDSSHGGIVHHGEHARGDPHSRDFSQRSH